MMPGLKIAAHSARARTFQPYDTEHNKSEVNWARWILEC